MAEKREKIDLEERLIQFSVRIIEIAEGLPKTFAGSHIAGQMIRSGTSPAFNYGEASSAESRKDFVHKIKIALKELKETRVAIRIIRTANMYPDSEKIDNVIKECSELIAIFITSVNTAIKNINSN